MAKPIPFRWITGLPPKAQKEIERNFLEIQKQLTSATQYDAWLDASLTASSPSTHTYINLSELVAGESWGANKTLIVGVVQTNTSLKLTEPSNTTIIFPGPIHVIAQGLRGPTSGGYQWGYVTQAERARQVIDINASIYQSQYTVQFTGLHFLNSSATTRNHMHHQTGGTSPLVLNNCVVQGGYTQDDGTFVRFSIDHASDWACLSYNTAFEGCDPGDNRWIGYDSHLILTRSLTMSMDIWWDGGILMQVMNNCIVTLADSNNKYIRASVGTVTGASSGVNWQFANGANCGPVTITIENLGDGSGNAPDWNSDVAMLSDVVLRGYWRTMVAPGTHKKDFDVVLNSPSGGKMNVTGPANISARVVTKADAINFVTLQGTKIKADLHTDGPAFPQVQLTNCDHSLIIQETQDGGQAIAIDATSTDNLVILGGESLIATPPGYSDLGARNRIITHWSDSWVTGTLLPSLLNVTFARPAPIPEPTPTEAEMEPWWLLPSSRGADGAAGAAGAPGTGGGGSNMPLAEPIHLDAEMDPWYLLPPIKGDTGLQGTAGTPGAAGSGTGMPLAEPLPVEAESESWWVMAGENIPNPRGVRNYITRTAARFFFR